MRSWAESSRSCAQLPVRLAEGDEHADWLGHSQGELESVVLLVLFLFRVVWGGVACRAL
jgi:hypothetical protein